MIAGEFRVFLHERIFFFRSFMFRSSFVRPTVALFQLARNKSWVVKKNAKTPLKFLRRFLRTLFHNSCFYKLNLRVKNVKNVKKKSWELKFQTPIFSNSCFLRVGIGLSTVARAVQYQRSAPIINSLGGPQMCTMSQGPRGYRREIC